MFYKQMPSLTLQCLRRENASCHMSKLILHNLMHECKICQTITKKSRTPPSKYNLCTIHKRLLLWGVGRIVDPENLNTRLPSYHISLTAGMKTICTCIFANCAHVYQNALLTLHRVPYAKIRHVTCRTFTLHDFILKPSQNKKGRIFLAAPKMVSFLSCQL